MAQERAGPMNKCKREGDESPFEISEHFEFQRSGPGKLLPLYQ